MKTISLLILFILLTYIQNGQCFLLMGAGIAAAVGAIYSFWSTNHPTHQRSSYYEPPPPRCSPNFDRSRFVADLKSKVFGQPLLVNHLIPSLSSHFVNSNPSRALSLIFLGSTGTGKNLVSSVIASNVYSEGLNHKHVRLFSGRLHFPLRSEVITYQTNLRNWIRNSVDKCARSIFIFDEIDKTPPGVIDSIKPFLDHHAIFDGVDYRKATFIFLTNVGGLEINKRYRELRENGVTRDDMSYTDYEHILRKSLFHGDGMFSQGDIVAMHVISAYIPFFPLEIPHVIKCIQQEFQNRRIIPSADQITQVMSYVDFHRGEWSESGCKRIADFVALIP